MEGEGEAAMPPLMVGAEGFEALIADQEVPAECKEVMKKWWQCNLAEAACLQQLALELKSWRCRKPAKAGKLNKGSQSGEYTKSYFAIKGVMMEMQW